MENQKGLVEIAAEKVWKFFSSVKLAVVLLISLAIVSIIGTVIQQNESPDLYLREYSHATVHLFETLGFFDLYHTWWFVLLLFLFTANLTVCSLERFPHTWKIIRSPLKPIEEAALRAVPFKREIPFPGGADMAGERAASVLRSHRYRFVQSTGPDGVQFMTQKGVYSRLGVYITHTSILLIFIGALLGSFFGFKAFLNLAEGTYSPVVYLRNEPLWDRIAASLGIAASPVIHKPGEMPEMPLGYFIQCDDFDVDYYINPEGMPTGMPSEYHSTLSIFDQEGNKILDKRIRVNDPLTFHGITFYQSSYGTMPDTSNGTIILNVRPKNAPAAEGTVVRGKIGQAVYVPSIDRTIKILGFMPYALRDPGTGQVQYYRTQNDEFINPAVTLDVYKGNKRLYETTVLKVDPGNPVMPEGYVISYQHYWGTRYTGLQVTKDPGVWVVYAGFLLLCIGPVIAFFGSHRKLWVRIQERAGETIITLAGSTNRNRAGFGQEFTKIADDFVRQ